MGLDLGHKVDVTAIAMKILSKFPLSPFLEFFPIPRTQRTSERSPFQ